MNSTMSVGRMYVIFRSMGLRHLVVLDRFHQVRLVCLCVCPLSLLRQRAGVAVGGIHVTGDQR